MAGTDGADDLDARERERARRRDRDLSAAERDLMRTGQAKVFKQVLDRQARRAAEPARKARAPRSGSDDSGPGPDSDLGSSAEPGADAPRRDGGL